MINLEFNLILLFLDQMIEKINQIIGKSSDRFELCIELCNEFRCSTIAELGVYRGNFAQKILEKCPHIKNYILVDPWRNLPDWNKPSNQNNETFEAYYQETLTKTDFAKEKRTVFRGKTAEVIDQIKDKSLDLAYIDGDHTLKGITIDLINLWPKVKENGFIVGDDFSPSIWQHKQKFEPTMIFPFAVYFAEAVNAKIYGLPYNQFLLIKEQSGFEFFDLTNGNYSNLELKSQFNSRKSEELRKKLSGISYLLRKFRKRLSFK